MTMGEHRWEIVKEEFNNDTEFNSARYPRFLMGILHK